MPWYPASSDPGRCDGPTPSNALGCRQAWCCRAPPPTAVGGIDSGPLVARQGTGSRTLWLLQQWPIRCSLHSHAHRYLAGLIQCLLRFPAEMERAEGRVEARPSFQASIAMLEHCIQGSGGREWSTV